MEKALLKLTFLLVLIASASCLLNGAEAREMVEEFNPDQIQCRVPADCVRICRGCTVDKCTAGLCVCGCTAGQSIVQT